MTEVRRGGNDAFKALIDHRATVAPLYDGVNIDWTINMTRDLRWMRAADAARQLGVSRATLYAYVSRGYIRSEARPGPARDRRYARADVERLQRRTEARRDPDKAAARALQWGMPILESSITLIAGPALYYRGHDAVMLSRSRSVADVASLIWLGRFDAPAGAAIRTVSGGRFPADHLSFVARAQADLALASGRDPHAYDLRPDAVAHCGWRILTRLSATAARSRTLAPTLEQTLARAWEAGPRGAEVLRAAIILCADHELNVSAFTARCVASSGSNPYAVVIAGLAAIEGTRHGGESIRAEAILESLRRVPDVRRALAERLRRGEPINGFGHPLYRDGDPRAAALLTLLRDRYPRSPELAFVDDVAAAAVALVREQPTIDFALAAMARVLRLPPGSPLTVFALGRTIGWIGHAIEQYATGQIIRPRAKYVGAVPSGPPARG
jgi:citrate synthase